MTSNRTLTVRPQPAVAAMRYARGGATATPEPSADHQLMAVLMDSPFPLQKCALGAVMGAFGSAVVRNEGSFRDIGACVPARDAVAKTQRSVRAGGAGGTRERKHFL